MSHSNRYQKMTVEETLEFERNSETKHEYIDGYVIPSYTPISAYLTPKRVQYIQEKLD